MRHTLIAGAGLAGTAACLLAAMLALAIASGGVTQQDFEALVPMAAYQDALAAAKPIMSLTLALDNLFILSYVASLVLGLHALGVRRSAAPTTLAVAGMVVVGLLDFAENLHFLTMYAQLGAGVAISETQVAVQMWASLMKWHVAYLALFMASFVIAVSGAGRVGAVLVWSLRLMLPVVGVMTYAAPADRQELFFLARYALMLVGFCLFAWVFASAARRAETQ